MEHLERFLTPAQLRDLAARAETRAVELEEKQAELEGQAKEVDGVTETSV